MENSKLHHVQCNCGKSDGNDDIVDSYSIVSRSWKGKELTVKETRRCDICKKLYKVIMHYELKFEEIYLED